MRRAPRPRLFLALAAGLLAAAGSAGSAAAMELVGTWHVLVHYKDAATENPERERWEDRIWVFSREGSRLQWADYPIVVFEDQSGRFEMLGTNRQSRVMHFWEPNESQLAQIRAGLEINSRGSRTKSLRGSPEKGWTSGRKGGGYQSARFITYEETWTIEGTPDRPVFAVDASLGSATSEGFEGRTVYETTEVGPAGDVLRGSFNRDGTRVGTFVMRRSGEASRVKGSGKTAGERVYEAFFGELGSQLYRGELPGTAAGGEVTEEALRERIAAGEFSEDDRRDLRLAVEERLARAWEEQGNDPRPFRLQIQSLARQMTDLFVDEGVGMEELGQRLQDGRLRP